MSKRFQPPPQQQQQLFVSTLQEQDTVDTTTTTSSSIDYYSRQEKQQLQQQQSSSIQEADDDDDDEYQRGLITIGGITLLFASNSPALHAAFTSFESPPPVLLVNAVISILALVGLVFGGSTLESNTPLPSSLIENNSNTINNKSSLHHHHHRGGGIELGVWKFLGTTANLAGLAMTTASHGAFLIQLTTLIVPVVQGLCGVPIPRRAQYSVGLALTGVFLFCTSSSSGSSDVVTSSSSSLGDALCVLAAIFYATYDLRLFEWGKQVPARELISVVQRFRTRSYHSRHGFFFFSATDWIAPPLSLFDNNLPQRRDEQRISKCVHHSLIES